MLFPRALLLRCMAELGASGAAWGQLCARLVGPVGLEVLAALSERDSGVLQTFSRAIHCGPKEHPARW